MEMHCDFSKQCKRLKVGILTKFVFREVVLREMRSFLYFDYFNHRIIQKYTSALEQCFRSSVQSMVNDINATIKLGQLRRQRAHSQEMKPPEAAKVSLIGSFQHEIESKLK